MQFLKKFSSYVWQLNQREGEMYNFLQFNLFHLPLTFSLIFIASAPHIKLICILIISPADPEYNYTGICILA